MGFKVNREDGQVAYYCFIVLVFGLKVASQVLGRVLKPLCIFLIQNGVPVIVYIDDGLVVAPSKEKAERRFRFALEVLEKAGFLVSLEKSSKPGDAAKCIHFLGVEINSGAMCVSASADKIAKLREFIARIVKSRSSMPVKHLASLVGKLYSLEPAFGPAILVGTRIVAIQVSDTAQQFGWKRGFLHLSEDSRNALRRVSSSLDLWNNHPILSPETAITLTSVLAGEDPAGVASQPNCRLFAAQYTLVSDASDTTVAAYGLHGRLADFVFVQALLPHEILQSSTHREMSAILKTILCRKEVLRMPHTATLWKNGKYSLDVCHQETPQRNEQNPSHGRDLDLANRTQNQSNRRSTKNHLILPRVRESIHASTCARVRERIIPRNL
jgi:hypothetical protein